MKSGEHIHFIEVTTNKHKQHILLNTVGVLISDDFDDLQCRPFPRSSQPHVEHP